MSENQGMTALPSPCISVCQLDPVSGQCLGGRIGALRTQGRHGIDGRFDPGDACEGGVKAVARAHLACVQKGDKLMRLKTAQLRSGEIMRCHDRPPVAISPSAFLIRPGGPGGST